MESPIRPWMKFVLLAAATYNLLWGFWVIARPEDMFRWTGIAIPDYLGIWQCVGMIVGVYGIGYGIAAFAPLRHWPIVLVGFLGKIFGPIGMLQNLWLLPEDAPGKFPASWLWLNLTNDLIWIVPFAAILYAAFKHWNLPSNASGEVLSVQQANQVATTQLGSTIAELSRTRAVLLLFLRHRGCAFCREALADLSSQRDRIESDATIVLVHMGAEDEQAVHFFDRYALGDVHRVSDPSGGLYRSYRLQRGRLSQLFGAAVWWRGFQAAILNRHAIGKLVGDGFQMPGAFLVIDNEVVTEFRHQTAADRPDYCKLSDAALT